MKKHYTNETIDVAETQSLRDKLIGLGEVSIQKSYYPQLQKRIKELEKFKALLNQSNDLIFFLRVPDMIVEDVNDFACELLGYTREEILNLPVKEYAGLQVNQWVIELVQTLKNGSIAEANTKTTLLTSFINRQKKRYPVEVKLQLVEWEGAHYIIAVARDISKHIQAEIKIKKLNVELERKVLQRTTQLAATNKELESFSYSVSHDLRAPLRTINGFSQAVLEDYRDLLDEQGQDYLNRILKASQHMGNLIDSLLLLSKSTRVDMKHEHINVSSLVFDSINRFKEIQYKDKQIEIKIDRDVYAMGDPQLLKIVIDNLLDNALKYSSNHPLPSIEFGTKLEAGNTIYYLKDNGAGFNMNYYEKLFTPFQRLHKSSEFQGTGVGLATVRRIITRHGGNIWAKSEVGAGTTFFFTLQQLPEMENIE